MRARKRREYSTQQGGFDQFKDGQEKGGKHPTGVFDQFKDTHEKRGQHPTGVFDQFTDTQEREESTQQEFWTRSRKHSWYLLLQLINHFFAALLHTASRLSVSDAPLDSPPLCLSQLRGIGVPIVSDGPTHLFRLMPSLRYIHSSGQACVKKQHLPFSSVNLCLQQVRAAVADHVKCLFQDPLFLLTGAL